MKKIITVIGARPQIIKSAAISRVFKDVYGTKIQEIVVHTGQHYDQNMSAVFFDEMGIPKPSYNLAVGSASHAVQSAEMMIKLEKILIEEQAAGVLLYGDTNSTFAGAAVASKLQIPIFHVEAGLRSFNKSMPEEVNRIVCDHLSTLLFSPTIQGYNNLLNEGFKEKNQPPFHPDNPKIFHCGDIMYDNSLYFSELADDKNTVIDTYGLADSSFSLCTIHRDHNTDNYQNLNSIFEALIEISAANKSHKIVLPLHPRTQKCMEQGLPKETLSLLETNDNILIIEPQSYFNILALEKNCDLVITDSGGLQKEAFFFKKPSLILRNQTEWVEIVESGNALIVGANKMAIVNGFNTFKQRNTSDYPPFYGDGNAAFFMCGEIAKVVL